MYNVDVHTYIYIYIYIIHICVITLHNIAIALTMPDVQGMQQILRALLDLFMDTNVLRSIAILYTCTATVSDQQHRKY